MSTPSNPPTRAPEPTREPALYFWIWREAFAGRTLEDRVMARLGILLIHAAAILVLLSIALFVEAIRHV